MDVSTVTQLLDEMAARFGATGTHLWGELVAYQVVGAWADALSALFAMVVFAAVAVLLIRKENTSKYKWEVPGWGWGGVISAVVALVMFGYALEFAVVLARTLAAPEAATLHALIGS